MTKGNTVTAKRAFDMVKLKICKDYEFPVTAPFKTIGYAFVDEKFYRRGILFLIFVMLV